VANATSVLHDYIRLMITQILMFHNSENNVVPLRHRRDGISAA